MGVQDRVRRQGGGDETRRDDDGFSAPQHGVRPVNPVAYFPGKLGDAVLQWPVARAWARKTGKPIDCWIDKTAKQLKPLLEFQPEVGEVKVTEQSKSWECGGQPWDGGFPTE